MDVSPEQLKAYTQSREALAFEASEAKTWDVLVAGYDKEMFRRLGVPLSQEEAAVMRQRLRLQEKMIPLHEKLSRLPGFAGMVVDPAKDGVYRIYVAGGKATSAKARAVIPPELLGDIALIPVRHSRRQLIEATRNIGLGPASPLSGITFVSARVDTAHNRVVVAVPDGQLEAARLYRDELEARAGVDLAFEVGEEPVTQACTSRGRCTGPMRAGNQIEQGSTSGPDCTMGYHINTYNDIQFVSAGHCGKNFGNSWYHDGWGYVGWVTKNAYTGSGVSDSMRVHVVDSEGSNHVWGSSPTDQRVVKGKVVFFVGLTVCMSGENSGLKCGTVDDDFFTYYSSSVNRDLQAASATYASGSGDSGAPVFWPGSGNQVWAAGIHIASSGTFARINDVLSDLNASLKTN